MKPLGTPITESDWNAMNDRQREHLLKLLGIEPALASHLVGRDRLGAVLKLASEIRRAAQKVGAA